MSTPAMPAASSPIPRTPGAPSIGTVSSTSPTSTAGSGLSRSSHRNQPSREELECCSQSCSRCSNRPRHRRHSQSPESRSPRPRRKWRSEGRCASRLPPPPPGGEAEVEGGGQVRLAARALDAGGEAVKDAAIEWFVASDVGSVDATGLVTGGYAGVARVAAVATIPGKPGQKIEFALVHVLPESPARVDVAPTPKKLVVGTRLTLVGTAYSKHGDRRADLVSFWSSNQKVVSVTPDGRQIGRA